jgi:hypothetical protein
MLEGWLIAVGSAEEKRWAVLLAETVGTGRHKDHE